MVRGSTVLLCLVMFVSLLASPVFADRSTEDVQSKIIERFDSPTGDKDASKYEYRQNHRWVVRGSKFITEGSLKYSWVKTYPTALFPNAPASEDYRALGVQAAFDRMGYNFLEFVPVEDADSKDGKPVEKGIAIPGRVKIMDFWVYGSNLKYYLEVQLRDHRGMVHSLRAGDLTFMGWRNFRIEIPHGIPQDVATAPSVKGLELVKIVLWTYPQEITIPFTFYIDHIKVLTDMFETPYDGSLLNDPKVFNDVWSSGTGTFESKATSGATTPATK